MKLHRKEAGVCAAWVIAALLGAALVAHAAETKTLEGTISNTHCGLKHSSPDPAGAACANACINAGRGSWALVVGDKVYELVGGDEAQLHELAALGAKVTGTVDGMKIQVSSIAPAGGAMEESM